MANSNLPRRIIKVHARSDYLWADLSPATDPIRCVLACFVWPLFGCHVVGSVQETQRLLSEPGWRALCLAVSVDFVKFFVFSEGRVLILLVKWFGLVRSSVQHRGSARRPRRRTCATSTLWSLGRRSRPMKVRASDSDFFYALFVLRGVETRVVILECF